MKIKDRILLGIVTGIIASTPGRVFNAIEYKCGLTDFTYGKAAGRAFVKPGQANTVPAKVIGSVANQALVGMAAVSTVYLLSATGRDHAALKGAGLMMVYWMALQGLLPKLGISLPQKRAQTPLLSMIDHIIFGAATGLIAGKLGHDSLFPDAGE